MHCQVLQCPGGEDPLVARRHPRLHEIVRLRCRADGGSFRLTFRAETTVDIPYNAPIRNSLRNSGVSQTTLESALMALPSVGGVEVLVNDESTNDSAKLVCGPTTPSDVRITFRSPHGDLPDVTSNASLLTCTACGGMLTLSVTEHRKGILTVHECNRRGVCGTSRRVSLA